MAFETEAECYRCGKLKPDCDFVKDPYIDEVYPESDLKPEWMCQDCYSERKDQI